MGQITQAINKMAVSLAEKEKLEEQLHRSDRLATLGRLVTGLAHEIRNPAAIIKATVQVLEREAKGYPDLNGYTKIIGEQVDRQNQIITELLEFGRPRPKIIQTLSINRLINSVLSFTGPFLQQNKVLLHKETRDDLPNIEGDGEQLKQVLVNLILNAVQAMPEGGHLRIVTYTKSNAVVIIVKDTGRGIAADDLKHIFDPFYTTREGGGGLGLAIGYQIIESHGGKLEAHSVEGKGSEFTITLPVIQERESIDDTDPHH
jgi:signal transduction histidine kinase